MLLPALGPNTALQQEHRWLRDSRAAAAKSSAKTPAATIVRLLGRQAGQVLAGRLKAGLVKGAMQLEGQQLPPLCAG